MLKIKYCNFQEPQPVIGLGPGPGPRSGPEPNIQTYKNKKSFNLRTLTPSTPQKLFFWTQETLNYLNNVSVFLF